MANLDIEEIVIKNQKITMTASDLRQLEKGIPIVIFASKTDTLTLRCDDTTTGLEHIKDLHKHHTRILKEKKPTTRKYTRTGEHTNVKREQAKKIAQENRDKREKLKGLESIVE